MAKKQFTWWEVCEGHYDLLHPENVEFKYRFHFPDYAPPDLKSNYVVNEEIEVDYDCNDASSLARDLKDIIDGYIYNRNKGEITKVINYLENNWQKEEYYYCLWNIEDAKEKIEEQKKRLSIYERDIKTIGGDYER